MFSGDIVSLRGCEPADIDCLLAWENNPSAWKITGTYIPFSRHTLTRYLEAPHDIFSDRQYRFMIIENSSGKPVGMIDLFDFEPYHQRAGIGILIGEPDNRGKGYGAGALALLKRYAAEHLGLKILFCQVVAGNTASLSLFKNAGFQQTAVLGKWHRQGDERLDEHLFILYL